MLNEDAYKSALAKATPLACSFEKAVLASCARCAFAGKHNIAEREAVSCNSQSSHEACVELHDLLREKAIFTLKLTHILGELPHAKELKIQCGGLLGLNLALHGTNDAPVQNVEGLLKDALEKFGTLEALPYSEIVKSIAAFEVRHRR